MKRLLLLFALASLAGCTTMDLGTRFTKADAGIPEVSQDEVACRREVADQPYTPDLIIGGVVDAGRVFEEAALRDTLLARCMQARGYTVVRPRTWYAPLMLHWN